MRIQSQIDTVILSLGSAPTLRRVDPYLQGVLGLRRERHRSRLGERYLSGFDLQHRVAVRGRFQAALRSLAASYPVPAGSCRRRASLRRPRS
jgi:hypothetical protein